MKRRNQKGQTLVMAAVALIVLLGFAGLAVDLGVLRYDRRLQQTAADAAAIAGADELRLGGDIVVGGRNAASINGFTDGTNCTNEGGEPDPSRISCATVTINNPPTSGPHAEDAHYVEAFVTVVQPTFFMHALGRDRATVTARAVATAIGDSGTGSGCVYTLGPPGHGIDGVVVSGTPILNAPTCGVFDNGDFKTNGKSLEVRAAEIGVAGDSRNNGGGCVDIGGQGCASVPSGMAPVSDPLASLQPPPVGTPVAFNPSATPVPGTTYSSVTINSTDVVNFPAGTYVVDGDFTINAGAHVCNQLGSGCPLGGTANDGVTFYITNNGTVKINGLADVRLSAPTSADSPYTGILFYQDPNDTSAAIIDGTSDSYYEGALYFPKAQITFGGTSLTNAEADYTIIVSYNLRVNGTATLNIKSDYSELPGGVSIIERAILVE